MDSRKDTPKQSHQSHFVLFRYLFRPFLGQMEVNRMENEHYRDIDPCRVTSMGMSMAQLEAGGVDIRALVDVAIWLDVKEGDCNRRRSPIKAFGDDVARERVKGRRGQKEVGMAIYTV